VLVAAMLLPSAARAATRTWQTPSGDWSTASNWSGGLPGANDTALISNGGTASIVQSGPVCSTLTISDTQGRGMLNMTAGNLAASTINLGVSGSGGLAQSGGTNNVSNLYVGQDMTGSGTYTLSGSGLLSGTTEYIGNFGAGSFFHSGGANTVSGTLYVGYTSASGSYSLTGSGLLNAANENLGASGVGAFFQSGGTNAVGDTLTIGNYSNSSYLLGGSGLLTAHYVNVGMHGPGSFTQSGGTNALSSSLELGYFTGSSGSYTLSGGLLAPFQEDIGLSGTGAFNQTGGTNTVNTIHLGFQSGGAGTYSLSGAALLSASYEYVGGSASSGLFQQSGGSNSTPFLSIGANGRYLLAGGTLQIASGGRYSSSGTVDGGNVPGTLSFAGSSIIDLSQGSLANSASMTLAVGPWSLLIVPPSLNPPAAFANYSNAGLLYTRGSPLTVPAGMGFSGSVSITDPVICQGSILATPGAINLSGGLQLSGTGAVYLGSGTLTTDNAASSISGGSLSTNNQIVGNSGTGSFTQSGGTNSTYALYLGYNPGSCGSYSLSGSGISKTTTFEYIGYSGSGSFSQSGGTNQGNTLYLGYKPGSSGSYSVSGNSVLNAGYQYVDYDPAATGLFQQTGGTNSPSLLSIGTGGRYVLAGGLLQFVPGNTYLSTGTLDCGNGPGVLSFGGSMVADLSQGALINTSSTTLNIGPSALLIVPNGLNPATAFASYSNSGSLHVRGTTFSIAPGQSYNLAGTIPDLVGCQGTLTSSWSLNLNGGVSLSGSGLVNLNGGTLTTDNATSSMSGGTLTAGSQYVGFAGSGSFTQSGGSNSYLGGKIYLGFNPGSNGTYGISNGGVSASALYIGNSGSGTFNQSGGSSSPGSAYVGYSPGSSGTCQLSGSGAMTDSCYVGYQGAGVFIQSGGTHSAVILYLAEQSASATGYYNLSNGSLSTTFERIGDNGSATFVQSGGTHSNSTSLYFGENSGATGTYNLSGGSLWAPNQYLGYSGTGVLTQTGGTNATNFLTLDDFGGSSGSCNLSGGWLTATTENIGSSGTGVFTQSGGTNTVAAQLLLGAASGSGTYSLSGSGVLAAQSEYMEDSFSTTNTFYQSGGSNSTSRLYIGQKGKYTFGGGTLQLAAGAPFSNAGVFDGGGAAGVLNIAGSSIFDITQGAVQNIGSMALSLGPGSLLITPSGFNPATNLGQYSNAGLLYTRGTPLTVPAGQGFFGTGSLGDQVLCQGNIAALGGAITLTSGLQLSGSGAVSLGSGTLTSQDATSGISGGSFSAAWQRLSPSGTGLFTQSGGSSVVGNLTIGSGGRYLLSGGTLQLSATGSLLNSGTLDGGNSTAALVIAGSSVLDLSTGTSIRTGSTQLSLGPRSLLIVPGSMNPATAFGSYSNQGLLYTRGNTLTIPAGQGFIGTATISDPLICHGSAIALGGGPINLNAALTLDGTGIVNMGFNGGLSLASGTTTVSGGSLSGSFIRLGNSGTSAMIQSGGTVNISNLVLGYSSGSGAYELSGGLLLVSNLSLGAGSGSFTFDGGTLQTPFSIASTVSMALSSGSSTIDTSIFTPTFTGALSGSGCLVKAGSGTLMLANAANTYSGGTQLSAGSLNFSNVGALGSGSIVFAGGVLQWPNGNTADLSARIAPIAAGVMAGIDTHGNNITFATPLSGSGGLTKLGSGALTLASSNTFSGTMMLSAGSLVLTSTAVLPNNALVDNVSGGLSFGSGITTMQFGSLAGFGDFALTNAAGSPVALTVGGNNANSQYTGNLTGSGGLTKVGSGRLTIGTGSTSNPAGTLYYSEMTNVNGGTLELQGGMGSLYSLYGTVPTGSTVNVNNGATLQLSRGDALGYWYGAAAAVNLNGSTIISSSAMAGYNWTTLPPLNLTGGTVTVATYHYVPPGVTGYGVEQYILDGDVTTFASSAASQITASEIYLRGNSTLSRTAVFNVAKGTAPVDLIVSGHLVVDPAYVANYPGLIKNGAGSLQLTDVVECPVIVNAGTLIASGTGMARSDVMLAAGGTLDVAGTAGDLEVNSLSGSGAAILQQGGLLVGSDTSSSTFSGTVFGMGGLTLRGGALTLAGSNTYTGSTIINNGVVDVINPLSLPDGANLSVGSAAAQLLNIPVVPSAQDAVAVPEPGMLALLAMIAVAARIWNWYKLRPGGGLAHRSDQDRQRFADGPHGQVQPVAPHRRDSWRFGRLRRTAV
jgi:autotransporter-associated beta strand protein